MQVTTYSSPNFLMTLAGILATLVSVYSLLIWIRIIMTWIRVPGTQFSNNPVSNFLSKIVDPYLHLFEGIKGLRRSRLDLTPLVAVAILSIVESLLRVFSVYGRISLGLILGVIVRTLWAFIFSMFFIFFIIMLAVRLFFCFKQTARSPQYVYMLDSVLGGLLNWVQRVFFKNQPENDRKLVIVSLVMMVVLYFLCTILVNVIINLLGKLPI